MRRCPRMAAIVRARRGLSQIAIFKIERAGSLSSRPSLTRTPGMVGRAGRV